MPVFDTTFFLDLLGRGGRDAARRAEVFARALAPTDAPATTRLNVGELLVGVELSRDPIEERRRASSLDGCGVSERLWALSGGMAAQGVNGGIALGFVWWADAHMILEMVWCAPPTWRTRGKKNKDNQTRPRSLGPLAKGEATRRIAR